ncbi:hypothetical protein K461DRAFT_173601 [Myriangium duriaei CBS 260.36]|uniref:Uncharacterized protein n=1 Tax=Myriangium duriaei CBS 260.36 TaxID=1168546 RepID=A0A9P4IXI8_9PEZI|nr:hypothetical protein K461DRAFT_173601 [Myriangium duriaei CBS 260.36]
MRELGSSGLVRKLKRDDVFAILLALKVDDRHCITDFLFFGDEMNIHAGLTKFLLHVHESELGHSTGIDVERGFDQDNLFGSVRFGEHLPALFWWQYRSAVVIDQASIVAIGGVMTRFATRFTEFRRCLWTFGSTVSFDAAVTALACERSFDTGI